MLHDLILLEGIARVRSRLDIHAVIIEVENGCLPLGKERFVVKLLSLAAEFNQFEIKLLDELSVTLQLKLLLELHHAVKGDEKAVAAEKIEVLIDELEQHAKAL